MFSTFNLALVKFQDFPFKKAQFTLIHFVKSHFTKSELICKILYTIQNCGGCEMLSNNSFSSSFHSSSETQVTEAEEGLS